MGNKKWQTAIWNIFWTRIILSVIISGWVKYDDSWRRRVMLRMNFLWIKTWREDREYDRKPERRNRRLEIGKTWNWRKSSGNDFKNFYSTLVLLFRSNLFPKSFLENFHWFCLTKFKLGILVSLKNNYYLTRIVYLRCLSVVTFTAFAVAYNQNRGRDPNPNLTKNLLAGHFGRISDPWLKDS